MTRNCRAEASTEAATVARLQATQRAHLEKRMPVPGRGSSPAAAAAASSSAGWTSAWPRAVRHASSSGLSTACGNTQPAGSAGTSTLTSPKRPPTRPAQAARCAASACARARAA